MLCLFICGHLSPNAERRALVKDVLVTLEKLDKLLWCTDLDRGYVRAVLNGETVQKTVQDMLDVSQTTFVLVKHLRSWSWCDDLRISVATRSRWWFSWVHFLSTSTSNYQVTKVVCNDLEGPIWLTLQRCDEIQKEHLQSLMLYAVGAVSDTILYSRWLASIVGVKLNLDDCFCKVIGNHRLEWSWWWMTGAERL